MDSTRPFIDVSIEEATAGIAHSRERYHSPLLQLEMATVLRIGNSVAKKPHQDNKQFRRALDESLRGNLPPSIQPGTMRWSAYYAAVSSIFSKRGVRARAARIEHQAQEDEDPPISPAEQVLPDWTKQLHFRF